MSAVEVSNKPTGLLSPSQQVASGLQEMINELTHTYEAYSENNTEYFVKEKKQLWFRIESLEKALLAMEKLPAYEKNFEYHIQCDEELKQTKAKLDRLEKWLEYKIGLCKKTNRVYEFKRSNYYSTRIKTLKEVRAILTDVKLPRSNNSSEVLQK